MSSSVSITTALCLAASDVETLIQGRMIAAISRTFINAIPHFAICPASYSDDETVTIQAWARLESCRIYSDSVELEKLAQLTTWSNQNLQNLLQERHKIFLAYLRVYRLSQPIEISAERVNSDKVGGFLKLPSTLSATTADSVLNDALFKQRYQQLINLEVPQHPQLEKLHNELIKLNSPEPLKVKFLDDLKVFLGWLPAQSQSNLDPDLAWIKTIATTGNSSNGDTFEKLVRKSLIKLGFSNSNTNPQASLDPDGCGGAGGLDFYCEKPYQVVGECKATKTETVPSITPAQLNTLGLKHLPQNYHNCIKIIVAAGRLNSHAKQIADGNKMNVMRPETLQRLVELKAKHPGSVNLIELQPCLEEPPFGENADSKVNAYIDQIWQRIKVRSYIIQLVQKLSEASVASLHGAYMISNPPEPMAFNTLETILIELSSPLTGYLGRRKARDGSDRFYFLRELKIE